MEGTGLPRVGKQEVQPFAEPLLLANPPPPPLLSPLLRHRTAARRIAVAAAAVAIAAQQEQPRSRWMQFLMYDCIPSQHQLTLSIHNITNLYTHWTGKGAIEVPFSNLLVLRKKIFFPI